MLFVRDLFGCFGDSKVFQLFTMGDNGLPIVLYEGTKWVMPKHYSDLEVDYWENRKGRVEVKVLVGTAKIK